MTTLSFMLANPTAEIANLLRERGVTRFAAQAMMPRTIAPAGWGGFAGWLNIRRVLSRLKRDITTIGGVSWIGLDYERQDQYEPGYQEACRRVIAALEHGFMRPEGIYGVPRINGKGAVGDSLRAASLVGSLGLTSLLVPTYMSPDQPHRPIAEVRQFATLIRKRLVCMVSGQYAGDGSPVDQRLLAVQCAEYAEADELCCWVNCASMWARQGIESVLEAAKSAGVTL